MGDFDLDTRTEGKNGKYESILSQDWEIWGPNGGYISAIALRAACAEAKIKRPISFYCHYLAVAKFAPVDIEVACIHAGARSESLRATIIQDNKIILEALVRTAVEAPGLEHDITDRPSVPLPENIKNTEGSMNDRRAKYKFWDNLEARSIFPDRFKDGTEGPPFWREWYRFIPRSIFDDPIVDAARQLLLIDTMFWPAAVQAHTNPKFLAPSLDVYTQFHRSDPSAEWLLADHKSRLAEGGLIEGYGTIWNENGKLLASGSSQLLCIPMG